MQNAAEFQTNLYPLFEYCTIVGHSNKEQMEQSADSIGSLSEEQVLQLARASDALGRPDIAKKCSVELRRRVEVWLELQHQTGDKFSHLADIYLESMATVDPPNLDEAMEFIRRFREPDRRYITFIEFLAKYGRFETLVAALQLVVADGNAVWVRMTQEQIVAVASSAGVDLLSRRLPDFEEDALLFTCAKALLKRSEDVETIMPVVPSGVVRVEHEYGPNWKLQNFFISSFFAALALALTGKAGYEVPKVNGEKPEWVQSIAESLARLAETMASDCSTLTFAACYEGTKEIEKVETRRPDSKERSEYVAFTFALRRIAIGVHQLAHLASGPALVGRDTLKTCRSSLHWDDALWIDTDLEQHLRLLDPAAAQKLLRAGMEQEGRTVTVFNERTDRWITLSAFAMLYQLSDYEICIRRAADCVVGYGWRKDMWLDQVLKAIRFMFSKGGADPRPWIRTLAPIINQVTEFTDGDETRHFRRELIELIAEVEPEWLPPLYEYHIARDEWHLAEIVHQETTKHADFSDRATRALTGTFVERDDIVELERRGREGDSEAAEAGARQIAYIGGLTDPIRAGGGTSEDAPDESKVPDITVYGPREIKRFTEELSAQLGMDFTLRELAQIRWLHHWAAAGRGDEVLSSAEEFFESGADPLHIEHMLDLLFELSLRVQGKKAAYPWLVRAHIHSRGWVSYWTSAKSNIRRLDAAAQHYPEKWLDFIWKTSRPARSWEQGKYSFFFGIERLVYFLLAVGQTELAHVLTQTFVDVSVEELSDQPIPAALWLPE